MLTDRQQSILFSLIDLHVKLAEPVSSKILAQGPFARLSSATIRNELNEMEEAGYLTQLHTSGGRLPTEMAYRLYVDHLTRERDIHLAPIVERKVQERIKRSPLNSREINRTIADLVHEISEAVAITNIIDERPEFYKIGLSGLFTMPEFQEFDRMFNLTQIFDQFERMFGELEKGMLSQMDKSVEVFIGDEIGIRQTKGETVILARYPLPGRRQGTLTVIGPMRMNYGRNIALVQKVVDEVESLVSKSAV